MIICGFILKEKKLVNQFFCQVKKKTVNNNVLALKINNRGLLSDKKLFTIDDMEKINFDKSDTLKNYDKNSYLYNVITIGLTK